MSGKRSNKVIVAVFLALSAPVVAGVAYAASVPVTDTNDVRLRIVKNEFADGFESTWHTHPGPVIVQVEKGSFKFYHGNCVPRIVGEGETFIETPGVFTKAIAKGEVAWTTTLVLPVGAPPATDIANPCE